MQIPNNIWQIIAAPYSQTKWPRDSRARHCCAALGELDSLEPWKEKHSKSFPKQREECESRWWRGWAFVKLELVPRNRLGCLSATEVIECEKRRFMGCVMNIINCSIITMTISRMWFHITSLANPSQTCLESVFWWNPRTANFSSNFTINRKLLCSRNPQKENPFGCCLTALVWKSF